MGEQFKTQSDAELRANAAQVLCDQKTRSAVMDESHAYLAQRSVSLLRSCEALRREVAGLEQFRSGSVTSRG